MNRPEWNVIRSRSGFHIERGPTSSMIRIPFQRRGAQRGMPVRYVEGLHDEADAHLVAAAPELDAELRHARSVMASVSGLEEHLPRIDAVLARAEGS